MEIALWVCTQPKPPLRKGRWLANGETEGLSKYDTLRPLSQNRFRRTGFDFPPRGGRCCCANATPIQKAERNAFRFLVG